MVDYDVVIVGAGIQGAGIAQICAAAGYRCLVLEKNAIASATSSNSSKLIHGGLRYLESAQYPLVYECLQERSWLIKNAPSLVRPVPFYIPIYDHSSRQPWRITLGLSLYAVLSGLTRYSRFKKLPKHKWSEIPYLKQQGIKAVFQYWDAATDDKLLTEAVMRSAQNLGVDLVCPGELLSVKRDNYINLVSYQAQGAQQQVTSYMLINAAGPWVNDVQSTFEPALYQMPVQYVQGSHLVIEQQIMSDGMLYLEHPEDQRAVFVMPWYGKTLLGTTEKNVDEYANPNITQQEYDYLLEFWQYYFPDVEAKVVDSMSGVRVLPNEKNVSVFKRSRDANIIVGKASIAIYGGKLTGFRTVSKKVLKEVRRQLGSRKHKADYDSLQLR